MGLVANWRNIAIALTDPDFGEQKAQSCENAWLQQLSPFTLLMLARI
jgi:hypothetical protein